MKEITIKQVLGKDGSFSHLELHQNGNVIELSLASTAIDTQQGVTYKWDNLKTIIDSLKKDIHNRAGGDAFTEEYMTAWASALKKGWEESNA